MKPVEEILEENAALQAQLSDAKEMISALTAKVLQLQNALDDKESQFREMIRRYAKRDANAGTSTPNGTSNGHGNGVVLKIANGSATNVSSSGVSIQSNGDATQANSAAVSPSAGSTQSRTASQNRSLADSATQTNSEDDCDDDQFDVNANRNGRNAPGSHRQVSFGFSVSPGTVTSRVSDETDVGVSRASKSRRSFTNGSGSSTDAKHSRTPSQTTVGSGSQSLSNGSQPVSNSNGLHRVSYADYVTAQRNEDYLSLAAFASINLQCAGTLQPSDNDDDATAGNSHFAQNRMSNSALPSVIPVPVPVRVDARRDGQSRPVAETNSNSAVHPVMSFAVAPSMPSQPPMATYSMSNFQSAQNSQPVVPFSHSSTSQSALDKQELARRCLELPVAEWKAGHVIAWLELCAGLQVFSRRCAENVKSGAILSKMTDAELEQAIGITETLHKRKLQLALAELRASTYNPSLKINSVSLNWITRTWLRDIGLSQYAIEFEQALVDGRLLGTLTKKDLEKYLRVDRKSHQASLMRSIELLRRFSFDVNAINERRARCEYVNADLLMWTNRRLSVWLKEIDLVEYSNIEQTGLNGAYIQYENMSIDSLCNALGIPSSKSHVRKHFEAKYSELLSAALPASLHNGATQLALVNNVVPVGAISSLQNSNGNANPVSLGLVNPGFSNTTSKFGVLPNPVNGSSRNTYDFNQTDYINLDANGANETFAQRRRNYVAIESVQRDSQIAAMRNASVQQTTASVRPMRNGDSRVRTEETDAAEREDDRNGKFVRASNSNRSASRKIASLRNSIGKAFSKKSSNQNDDRAN